MVLGVPVHAPVEELGDGVKLDRPHAQAEVGNVVPQATVHGQADEILEPVADEDMAGNEHRQYGQAQGEAASDHTHVKKQAETEPS